MRSPSSIETTNNEAQGSGTEDEIIGQRIEEILAIAKREGREDVPDSFCNSLVRSYVGDNCRAKSAEELFDTLRTAVDCREEIHELERSMDKSHFVELVTGGYFVSGGVEKDSNLPIFWFESGRVNNNAWKYKVGSPHANAFIRYVAYAILSEACADLSRFSCAEPQCRALLRVKKHMYSLYLTCSSISPSA